MCNGHRICHGGLIFTLADTAMAFASNSHDETAVATSASVEFVESAREGDRLRATAVERHRKGRNAIYDVSVDRVDGSVIALFRGHTLTIGGRVSEAS
jgi:acyl-CoA thioesterase